MVYLVNELNLPIPNDRTQLYFNLSPHATYTITDLIRFLSHLPQTVTSLDLSCFFPPITETDAVAILKAIPPSVTHLDLSSNKLGKKKGDELIEIICAIPPSVTHLDLSSNQLGQKSEKELVALFNNIRPSVISLNLPGNLLRGKKIEELENISRALDVSSIDSDDLYYYEYTALIRYKGYYKQKIVCQFLYASLPIDLCLEVLNYLSPVSENDFKNLLDMDHETKDLLMQNSAPPKPKPQKLAPLELPAESIQWLNQYSIGALTAIVTAVIEAIIFFATHMTINSTLMWAVLIAPPIALGLLAAICFNLCEAATKPSDLSPI